MTTIHVPDIEILDNTVIVSRLVVEDERAVAIVRRAGHEAALRTLISMIRVGAEGLEAMNDVHHIDFVREQVSSLVNKTERAVDQLAVRLVEVADGKFDPAQPGSYSQQLAQEVNRARAELTQALGTAVEQIREDGSRLRRELDLTLNPSVQGSTTNLALQAILDLLARVDDDFDPENKNGHTAALLTELGRFTGAGGPIEARIRTELKVVRDEIGGDLRALRDVVIREQTARITKPASIGDDFEAAVETVLAQVARHADGDWVQDVSREVGEVTNARVGDFDYHLADGGLIAIEARSRGAKVHLGGKTGVLEELERTKANRSADFAIYCVSSEETLPEQIGFLERFNDRIVCCFGNHGEILAVAVKFARLCLLQQRGVQNEVSAEVLKAAIEEIQRKVATLGTVKRWCSNISESAEKIRAQIGTVTIEVAEAAERALAALASDVDAS